MSPHGAVYAGAHEFPELPGARVIVQREGGRLPSGYWRVLGRVIASRIPPLQTNQRGPSGLRLAIELREGSAGLLWDLWPLDILLVAPCPAQAWWERAAARRLTREAMPLEDRRERLPVRSG